MSNLPSPEQAHSHSLEKSSETRLSVQQPPKMKELGQLLETLDALSQRVGERTSEDNSGDMGGAGGMVATGGAKAGATARDNAIAHMPNSPVVLKKELTQHIEGEIEDLKKEARKVARTSQTGGAFELNELYGKIRKLRSLLHDIVEASIDVLKRIFIRVFIDKQAIL